MEGSQCIFSCKERYSLVGANTLQCSDHETGMAPFPRVSKVRTHESSIIINSTYVALSVNYMVI